MLRLLLISLRPQQWAKNLFVLAPLVFAERLDDGPTAARSLLAFVVFSAAASGVYLSNDLADRKRDRRHPRKRHRPLAAGTLHPVAAVVATILLTVFSFSVASILGGSFVLALIAYLTLTTLYTLKLKTVVILDVMTVSLGYVVRVVAGATAIDVEVSTWLLLCTTFLALFLTFSKRRHELLLLADSAPTQREVLAHYNPTFLDQMINVVTASTLLSYAFYVTAPETVDRFHTRALIYTLPFVLFGIFRYLYLVYQDQNDTNPTEAILRDLPSLANVVLWGTSVVLVIYLL